MTDLRTAAYHLAEEIWENKWDHVTDLRSKPVGACVDIINELRRRCPGHTLEEYKRAMADGMFDSR
jgi:hypothetical protein